MQLGRAYARGTAPVARSTSLAEQWFERAARLGNENALTQLGHLYAADGALPEAPRGSERAGFEEKDALE